MNHPPYLPLVGLLKALAAQLIVWHHFARYGPLSERVDFSAWRPGEWLVDDGRLAVQVFLVIGGFLSGGALLRLASSPQWRDLPLLLGRRYQRLMRPYAVAMLLAIAAAALARGLISDPSVPLTPTVAQLAAHALLLNDILGVDALSAGVWYVAIDFQLYALLCLLFAVAGRFAPAAVAALAMASLFLFNRDGTLEVWGLYFFGAYGLGFMTAYAAEHRHRKLVVLGMAAVTMAALVVEWRSRIALAGLTALLLATAGSRLLALAGAQGWIRYCAERSYALFLVHYPVLMAVGAVVQFLFPDGMLTAAVGLGLSWAASMLVADRLYIWVERARQA